MSDVEKLIRLSDENATKLEELRTRKYEARYGLYKILVGTAFVGFAAAFFPAAVGWVTEYRKSISDYRAFISSFSDDAANQDIEIRIRIAEYFSKVSTREDDRERWTAYLQLLESKRDETRKKISNLHGKVDLLHKNHFEKHNIAAGDDPVPFSHEDQISLLELERELEWAYGEIGSVLPGESIGPAAEQQSASGVQSSSVSNYLAWEFFREFKSFVDGLNLKYFQAEELLVLGGGHNTPGGPCAGKNTFPPRHLWSSIVPTVRFLEELQEEIGAPITLTNVYRAPEYNECIGGSAVSKHTSFAAIDFKVSGMPAPEVATAAAELRNKKDYEYGIGIGRYNSFTHIDNRDEDRSFPSVFAEMLISQGLVNEVIE